ncbi:MAG: potassium channel family protein [Bacteroidota bacterium]
MKTINMSPRQNPDPGQEALDRERYELLQRLEDWLETPMVVLAFVWLALLVGELVWGQLLAFEVLGTAIWVLFIIDFAIKVFLASNKVTYVKRNWLTAIALLVPALRIFRVFWIERLLRFTRVGRELQLFRVVSSLNRGMRALGAALQRRGFGYVILLTLLVLFAGSAGMYALESQHPGSLNTYGEALWWTAMVMTTMGSQYWPQTFEGRLLCFFLALYAFAVFGYVTATLATFFVGRDAENSEAEIAGSAEVTALRAEVQALRDDIRELSQRF